MRPGRLAFVLAACALVACAAWFLRAPEPGDVAGVGLDSGRVERAAAPSAGLLADRSEVSRAAPVPGASSDPDATPTRTLATSSSSGDASDPSILGHATLRVLVLRDADGAPFPGARVTLRARGLGERHASREVGARVPPSATSDAAGTAQFDALASGSWTVIADAPGHAPVEAKIAIRRSQPVPDVVLRLAVQRQIAVRLVDPAGRDLDAAVCGLPPDDVMHVVLEVVGACWLAPAASARSDEITRTGQDDAPFRWSVLLRGGAPACVQVRLGDAILAAQPVPSNSDDIALRVRPSSFAALLEPIPVRIVSGIDDEPVSGALVTTRGGGGRFVAQRADDDGRARVAPRFGIEPELVVVVPGFATARVPLRRPADGEIVVRLGAGRRIGGVLREADGTPVPRATILLHAVGDDGAVSQSDAALVKSSREGHFRFEDVAPGAYAVGVQGASRASATALPDGFRLVDCTVDDVLDVELVRAPIAVKTRRARR